MCASGAETAWARSHAPRLAVCAAFAHGAGLAPHLTLRAYQQNTIGAPSVFALPFHSAIGARTTVGTGIVCASGRPRAISAPPGACGLCAAAIGAARNLGRTPSPGFDIALPASLRCMGLPCSAVGAFVDAGHTAKVRDVSRRDSAGRHLISWTYSAA